MNKPILTVCIAAYNVESFIEQTLKSLILKENSDFVEVLIINDGSTDKTPIIARKYADHFPSIFKIINKENGGHGSTINQGIQFANGKYFKVLDGDDWFDTNELKKLVEALRDTDVDLLLSDCTDVYPNGSMNHINSFKNYHEDTIYDIADLKWGTKVFLPTITIKTELLRRSGLRVKEKCFYEDMEYNVYCIFCSRTFCYKKIDVYRYRKGLQTQSISFSSKRKNIEMTKLIAYRLNEFYEEKICGNPCRQRTSIEYHIIFIMYTAYVTYLSFSPSNEIKNELFDYIDNLESRHLVEVMAFKKKIFGVVYNINNSYYLISGLYRLLKGIRE